MSGDDGRDLLDAGGKVDADALRRAVERAGPEDADARRVAFELRRDVRDRLDRYLTSRLPFMSRTQIQRMLDEGHATVNARPARASTRLRVGDRVEVVLPPPPSGRIEPEPIPVRVLYEDEHLIVLDKHAGIIVHPARSHNRGTLVNALAWRLSQQGVAGPGGEIAAPAAEGPSLSPVGAEHARPGVVHRLDRDTTGCIVFAKTEEAHWRLAAQFERRQTDKRYLALAHGRVAGALTPEVEAIDEPLGPHPSREKGYREKRVVRHDNLGKPSLTIARVRERYRDHNRPVGDQDLTLVELELRTGRTHQIRVHLSHRGWPLVGDDLYGGRPLSLPGGVVVDRQMLHAALLAFEHPITGRAMAFTAPPPADMLGAVEHLRRSLVAKASPPQSVPLGRLGLARPPAQADA